MYAENRFLVRLFKIEGNKNSVLSTYFVTNGEEHLKFYKYCFENDIEMISPNDIDEYIYIKNIQVIFGGEEAYPCIDIYAEVF